ncbi:MAG: RNA polymerase sigma factor [Planctomycetaceae bacterium]|nr:RNA polymerase sigma factor [Planctomycetaceae bacterium]
MPPGDIEIMTRVQAGEVELFDLLVERYRDALLRVAWSKLGNAAWAEDVVQESLLAAYAARNTYNPAFEFRTWLWTILLNLCRRQWQRRERRPREESCSQPGDWKLAGLTEPMSADGGLVRVLQTERRELLHKGLLKLPEPQADALRLRFLGELPFAEIALTMNSSVSAAKQRVKYGLQALAALLREDH